MTTNIIDNLTKVKKIFEYKFNEINNDFDNDYLSSEISLLGKKRINFIERNGFKNENYNEKFIKSGFLKYSQFNNEKNEKCYEPKGVKYSISQFDLENQFKKGANNYNYESDLDLDEKYEDYKSNIEEIKIDNYKNKGILNSKSLMLKTEKEINFLGIKNHKNKIIKLSDLYNKENINSMYCKDFVSLADENNEFFRRVFSKLNMKKDFDLNFQEHEKNNFTNNEFFKESKENLKYEHKK